MIEKLTMTTDYKAVIADKNANFYYDNSIT